jgi:hypothetical protein
MGIVALVTGCLALVGFALAVPLNSSIPGLLGIVLSVIALVTGIIGRRQKSGIAGLVLGAIGLVLVGVGFLMLTSRAVPMSSSPSPSVAAPVIAPAMPQAAPPPQSK